MTAASSAYGAPQPQPYSIKRHGLTLANCDSEPVGTPGCVQAHGVLLVVRPSDLGILQASDNTATLLGRNAAGLLGLAASTVIGALGQSRLRRVLDGEPTERNPVHLLTIPAGNGLPIPLDVSVHTVEGVALLEFEATGRADAQAPDYYALVRNAVARLQTVGSLRQFCDSACQEIQQLTGFDRVMIHKFHADGHGEVFAENRRANLSTWLGTHYPAEDIPQPARDIFSSTWIRPVPDTSSPLAEMLPLADPDTGKPLDMTHCTLRGTSIMYTEYLRNMEVAAALTMAIRVNGQLWGLIACHHYAGPKHLPYQMRAACEFLAQVVSLQHQSAEDKENLVYQLKVERCHQQLLAASAREGGLVSLTHGTPSLLDGIDAGGVALHHLGRWWRAGAAPTEAQLNGLGEWLRASRLGAATGPLYATDRLAQDYLPAAEFAGVASGLLAVPISLSGEDLLLWFRPETLHTIRWRGDPHEKTMAVGPHGARLTPRRSFELFAESVRRRSLPWKPLELKAVAELRLLLVSHLMGRIERGADLNADLARSNAELDAFAYVASHDLKEPLRGIHQFANQLLDDETLAKSENRGKLEGLMRLTVRMDSLLDSLLHFSRLGRAELTLEPVDLNALLAEAMEMMDARTSAGPPEVVLPRSLPTVQCNRVRCRQVWVNLLSNALKYNDRAQKRVEVGYIAPGEVHDRALFPPASAGHMVFYIKDNGIGIPARQHEQVFKMFRRLHGQGDYGGGTGAGLAIVRKLVEQQRGRVWLDSTPGLGTTFYFTLPGDDTGDHAGAKG